MHPAFDMATRLGRNAEAACRHYLPRGRRDGRYWLVGDKSGSPGRSLYVRLIDSSDGTRKAGKWTDASTGEHGDLLDIIASVCCHSELRQTLDEARHFLSLPAAPKKPDERRAAKAATGSPEAARRLWAASRPLWTTTASAYLARRGLVELPSCPALRFHPRCYYRPSKDDVPGAPTAWPALIAAVTDSDGEVIGVQRTWLDPITLDKAAIDCPRRAMGMLLGNAVRFGSADSVMVAGEGLETILSLRQIAPSLPMMAGLSAAHLAAIAFPPSLRRLYVARDNDPAGAGALARLTERTSAAEIEILALEPLLDDFNSDLCYFGCERLAASVRSQLLPEDAVKFLIG